MNSSVADRTSAQQGVSVKMILASFLDFVIGLMAFILLMHWRLHPWKVVLITAAASAILSR